MITAEQLGIMVRDYRISMGFTQKQVGELVGLSERMVWTIEHGKGNPRLNTMRRIENVLEITPERGLLEDVKKLRVIWWCRGYVDAKSFLDVMRTKYGLVTFYGLRRGYLRKLPNGHYLFRDQLKSGGWEVTMLKTYRTWPKGIEVLVEQINSIRAVK